MLLGVCIFCKSEFRKREAKYKFCSLICANRFNLNGLSKVELPKIGINLAEFIGICLGDGCASKYQVSVTLNSIADKDYAQYVFSLSRSLFPGATISLIKRTDENSVTIRINSRIVSDFIKSMGIVSNAKHIPLWIMNDPIYRRYCMKGLFDTEGSISFKRYISRKGVMIYKQLNFRNINVLLMTFVRDNLVSLGLKPTMTLKASLYLSNDKSIATFRELVGFGNPKLMERSLISDINAYEKYILLSDS